MLSQKQNPWHPEAGKQVGYQGFADMTGGCDCAIKAKLFEVPAQKVEAVSSPIKARKPVKNDSKARAKLESEALALAESAAARVCERFSLQSSAKEILCDGRIVFCMRRLVPHETEVKVLQSLKHGGTFYGNLWVCDSLWVCPVCAGKITEKRRVDLVRLVSLHKEVGGQVVMVTLTYSHKKTDSLKDTQAKTAKALEYFKSGKAAARLRKFHNLAGTITAKEITHGEINGWHLHFHELWFLDGVGHDLAALEDVLYEHWRAACLKAGLGEPARHIFKVQGGDYAAKYVGKWGMESEMTKGHVKKGKEGHYTPFDLLRLYRDGGDYAPRAAELFREYADAMHGVRQLFISTTLKKRYPQVEVKTDEELNKQQEDEAALLGLLNPAQWRRVENAEKVLKRDIRGQLLRRARLGAWQGVLDFLEELPALSDRDAQLCNRESGLTPQR